MGTPRTIGETIGSRLRPKLQVLTQYLIEQLAAGLPGGSRLSRDDVRKALRPSLDASRRLEPSVWMELESMAHAAELPPEDLLLVHGYCDMLGFLRSAQPIMRSTYVALNAVHTDHGLPRMALAWHLDPALLPYVTLIRRIPAHGPASIALTLAGLHPVAGMSEAGVAVAANELRVEDGAPGHLTPHLVAACLTAPSRADAEQRVLASPRQGGACIHLLDAAGERATYELSGQQALRLPDPWPQSPRVHCNQAVSDEVLAVSGRPVEISSKSRLERIASLAVDARACTPTEIAGWFRLVPSSEPPAPVDPQANLAPESTVLLMCDPGQHTIHLVRGGTSQGVGSATL
jgi:hypothetical protein